MDFAGRRACVIIYLRLSKMKTQRKRDQNVLESSLARQYEVSEITTVYLTEFRTRLNGSYRQTHQHRLLPNTTRNRRAIADAKPTTRWQEPSAVVEALF